MQKAVIKKMADTFVSMKFRNFRLFMFGQFVSLIGNWMQVIALSWTAYEITQSATSLGIIAFLSYAPLLIFGIFGGAFVDRYSKYKTLFWTQAIYSIAPLIVSYYFFIGDINIYILYLCAAASGFLRIVDNPARQTFRLALIPVEYTKNSISLFSASHNFAKILGPLLAGILLSSLGPVWCFFLNGISFWFVLLTLVAMNKKEFLHRGSRAEREGNTIINSLASIWKQKIVRNTLILSFMVGVFLPNNMQVAMPIFIKEILSGDVVLFATLMSTLSAGAVLGGLYSASDKNISGGKVLKMVLALCVIYLGLIFANNVYLFGTLIFLIGFCVALVNTGMNSLVFLHAEDRYLGMTSSLWTMSMVGTTSLGGLLIGFGSDVLGIQITIAVSATIVLFFLFLYCRKVKKLHL